MTDLLKNGAFLLVLLGSFHALARTVRRRPASGAWRGFAARLRARGVEQRDTAWLFGLLAVTLVPALVSGFFPAPAASAAPAASSPVAEALAFLAGPLLFPAALALAAVLPPLLRGLDARDGFGLRGSVSGALRLGVRWGMAMVLPLLLLGLALAGLSRLGGTEPEPQPVFRSLGASGEAPWRQLWIVLCGVLFSPLGEEAAFRGLLLPALLRRRGVAGSVVLSSLFFAAIHLHLDAFLPLACVGACLSLAYLATGRLLVPVAMHATYNAASLLLAFLE
jgi:membrane protease YdiL (CAAX protease family)